MPRSAVLIVVCLWLGAAHGATTNCPCGLSMDDRIVGGTKVPPNQYPWVVSLSMNEGKQHICGASIINPTTAITAAHCTLPNGGIPLAIVAGSSDRTNLSASQIVPVAKYLEHEKFVAPVFYPEKTINDISLLFLARPLQFNANVGPVCMPTDKIPLDDQWTKVLGWGKLGGDLPPTKDLMEVNIQVKPFEECRRVFPFRYPQTQICLHQSDKGASCKVDSGCPIGACKGDSGGPIVYLDPETDLYTLVGLVSFGSSKCDPRVPTAATEVGAFASWIQSKITGEICHKI